MPDIRSTNVPGRSPGTISASTTSAASHGNRPRRSVTRNGPTRRRCSATVATWSDLPRARTPGGTCVGATWAAPCSGIIGATLGLVIASWVLPGFDVSGWEDALRTAVLVAVIGALLRVLLVEGAIRLGWIGQHPARAARPGPRGLARRLRAEGPGRRRPRLGAARLLDHRVRLHLLRLDRDRRHRRRGDRLPAAPGATPARHAGRPRRPGHRLRAGRRRALPGARLVRARRHPADPLAVDPQRLAPRGRVAPQAPRHHAGQPDGHPARHHRRHPGVPLGRPRRRARCTSPTAPPTPTAIEAMHSDGLGLLADDGVSISNLFTGDAPDGVRHDERDRAWPRDPGVAAHHLRTSSAGRPGSPAA